MSKENQIRQAINQLTERAAKEVLIYLTEKNLPAVLNAMEKILNER